MDTRAILIRQIRERSDQMDRANWPMLWDLTAENIPEQEAWDIEHPPIVQPAPARPGVMSRGRSFNNMSLDDLRAFAATVGSTADTERARDQQTLAEIFLKELAKRGRL